MVVLWRVGGPGGWEMGARRMRSGKEERGQQRSERLITVRKWETSLDSVVVVGGTGWTR